MKTTLRQTKLARIPPPPSPEDGYDAIVAYFQKHTPEQLERSGHLKKLTAKELRDLEVSAAEALKRRAELRVRLPVSDFLELRQLANSKGAAVESLASRWLRERIRAEKKR